MLNFPSSIAIPLLLASTAVESFTASSVPSRWFDASTTSSTSTAYRASQSHTALHMDSTTTNNNIFDFPEDSMPDRSSDDDNSKNSNQNHHNVCEDDTDSTASTTPSRYLSGDELHRLRQRVLGLRQSLDTARTSRNTPQVRALTRAIVAAQQLDAEFMYQVSLERLEAATYAGLTTEAEAYRADAADARAALPQFQLEGLWVGKYGNDFQMVNVSYTGDVLTAHKVTGDRNVPKGQVTFQVDLSPAHEYLEPIQLSQDAAEQWKSRFLQRHSGQGQVAADGFEHSQWLDGQLILVNQYFSFAWLPTGDQVFFGRPSADLTLKLLRQSNGLEATGPSAADVSPRQHLQRCLEETELLQDDMDVTDGLFQSHDQMYYYDQAGCFE